MGVNQEMADSSTHDDREDFSFREDF